MRGWLAPLGVLFLLMFAGCAAPDESHATPPSPAEVPEPTQVLPGSTTTGTPETSVAKSPTVASTSSAPEPESSALARPVQADWRLDGTLEATVPVDVILVGWESDVPDALRQARTNYDLTHFRLRSELVLDSSDPAVTLPGTYREDTPATWRAELAYHAMDWDLIPLLLSEETGPPYFDANALEADLAQQIAAAGIPVDGPIPPLVVLNVAKEDEAYRQTYDNGYAEGLRIWGSDAGLLVLDLGAQGFDDDQPYDQPVAPSDASAAQRAIEDALAYRLLQGAIYAPPLAPCHALTIVHAQQAANRLIDNDGDFLSAARSQVALQTLTDEPYYVDYVELSLPEDDPVLEALLRGNPYHGAFLEGIRSWVETRWDDLYVPHDGCEPLMAFMAYTDYLDNSGTWGIALHDASDGHRFSFSAINYNTRSYLANDDEPSVAAPYFGDLLVVHETGHLMGLPHPHNALADERGDTVWSMSYTQTPMSYLTGWRALGFGPIDQSNWDRNRAAYALEAIHVEHRDAAEAAGVQDLLEAGDWQAIVRLAQDLLA